MVLEVREWVLFYFEWNGNNEEFWVEKCYVVYILRIVMLRVNSMMVNLEVKSVYYFSKMN